MDQEEADSAGELDERRRLRRLQMMMSLVMQVIAQDSNLTVGVFLPDSAPDRATVPNAPTLSSWLRAGYTSSIAVSVPKWITGVPGWMP